MHDMYLFIFKTCTENKCQNPFTLLSPGFHQAVTRNADGSDISKKHEVNVRRAWEISESQTAATQRTPF